MPSISSVQICNFGLSHVGAKGSIESLDEASREAQVCKLWFDWSRNQVLEDFNWPFARKRQTLALLADEDPPAEWSYRYGYPSDCVKARFIVNPVGKEADAIPFQVETISDGSSKSILTDLENAVMVYTFDQSDPTLFSSKFIDALSYRVASNIAFQITGDPELSAQVFKIYQTVLRSATGSSAQEGIDQLPRDAEWIRARF